MRAFVAVAVPSLAGPAPRELRPEDHLTLQFFADLSPEQVPLVLESVRGASSTAEPFDLELRGVGAFPDARRPRVLWAGVSSGSDELHALADQLRQALAGHGFALEERPYVPHLTLARIRSPRDVAWARRFLSAPEMTGRVWSRTRVSELLLKESVLLPLGPRHTTLARVPLGRPPP